MGPDGEPATTSLADQLERSFRGGAWHGPALMEVLAGVDAATAQWRPDPSIHSVAEEVGHLAFWLEDARRQISGEARRAPGAEVDWGPASLATEAAWQALCAELESAHLALRAALLEAAGPRLEEALPGSDTTLRGLVLGILQHNAYHAGQMALLLRQARLAGGGRP
ncbi:MAG: DinB-like domain protein [Holophagaceae bacterium]|nr:DinB-like domain protein [Holophagaceae bacterium]